MLDLSKLKDNILIFKMLLEIKNFLINMQYNKELKKIIKIDSILDYNNFKDKIQKFITNEKIATYKGYCSDSLYYGYYNELLKYSDFHIKSKTILFSNIEHGIRMDQCQWKYYKNSINYVAQGEYRKKDIQSINKWKPVFSIGPYIHYANKFYSEEKENEIKKSLGKVLLIFPSHTNEWERDKATSKDFVDYIYEKYDKMFDTFLVCSYWKDVNDDVYKKFMEKGAKIVSAGFRGDVQFIKRLKTIISLSDAVVGDDIATNIGFCLYMNKPFALERNEPRYEDKNYQENFRKFKEAFTTEDFNYTYEQRLKQEKLYNYFWGGENNIKSKQEIYMILEFTNELLKKSHYSINKLDENTKIAFNNMDTKTELYKLFKSSLGEILHE